MARSDLIFNIIKYGLNNDKNNFIKSVEAICAEERAKQHNVFANKIEETLRNHKYNDIRNTNINYSCTKSNIVEQNLAIEKMPEKRLDDLLLPKNVRESCNQIIEEQLRSDILRSYGVEPRNKILLVGPPGNGKTSLAEAIAQELSVPLLTVKYESIIGSYLGETANRLSRLIEYASARQCVLFFDEFETLGKERGDKHETGEIKRVVSSLLLHIDSLPSYVVVIGATNHESLLDRAAWRRFQIKLNLPKPEKKDLEKWYALFEKKKKFSFGVSKSVLAERMKGFSFAENEELALSIYRRYILNLPIKSAKRITEEELNLWDAQVKAEVIEKEVDNFDE